MSRKNKNSVMKALFQKLYTDSRDSFYKILNNDLQANNKRFIVTANPEAFVLACENEDIKELILSDNTTVVADGIGIVKTASHFKCNLTERIPGVEISKKLLEYADSMKKSLYLFGAKAEVVEALADVVKKDYPNIKILGFSDGYVDNKDAVFEEIKALSPDIILVALGMPHQERLIYRHLNDFNKGIFVGVGGSFDVLSGKKIRAPKIFIKLNLEWLYRISREPKRIKRFIKGNVKFLFMIFKSR